MTTINKLIAIQNPHKKGEKILISEHDYDPKEHKLFGGKVEEKEQDDDNDPLDFSKLKDIPAMKAFAAKNNIDLGDAKSKADILKKLEAWKEEHAPKE